MATLGETLVRLLEIYGTEVVFGIPGVHTAELYRGLAASPIRHVTPRHEQGAGFMADGYARVTGKPGVAMVISGPGLANIATAMMQAKADSIPMLVIAGVNSPGKMDSGNGHLHEMPDQRGFAAHVAAFAHTVLTPEELPQVMARAFAVFEGARPGPVMIEIPVRLMRAEADHVVLPDKKPEATLPAPDPQRLAAVVAACRAATSPVILIGGGARRGAADALALAESLDCPVIGTINARASLPKGHPLAVPMNVGMEGVRDLLEESDLVLAFGTEFGPTDFDIDEAGPVGRPKKLVRVDIDPEQLMRNFQPDIGLVGDAATALRELRAALGPERRKAGGAARAAGAVRTARETLPQDYRAHIALLDAIRDRVPDAAFVGDSTQLVYAGNLGFETGDRGHWFNSAVGFGTLGYAVPAAIGAALGRPGAPVIAIVGDGGLQFTLAELGTLADCGVPVVVIVWNNGGYLEIRYCMESRGIAPEGVSPSPPDFAKVAEAYGIEAMVLDGPVGLAEAVADAVSRNAPFVIDVRGV
ncbi:5-guanidino-2-oxopentanoate decarboxylase [Rhodobium gokarnense]|uniref:Acetolactate synthase-1/2/3 large subunit n=1 Tax=Rhodobium gokarnense TaxID=364296 RepID=A0ABT3HBQ9_9HYPH|nr:5-guanidino-2-oxopentanoate decarboxylase [Rhodobium gokarnense]MCW2307810.1 acetolactate synthase-1/2/3 large subunit [Rhodobium gokarnense]